MRQTFIKLFITLWVCSITVACTHSPAIATQEKAEQVQHLLRLIAQRLDVAPLVARSKWSSGGPVDDPAREQLILEEVQKQAFAIGLTPQFAAAFFQSQFDAGKLIQRQLHQEWQHHAPLSPVPDLAKDVRPILDTLSPQLLTAIKQVKADVCLPYMQRLLQAEASPLAKFDAKVRGVAVRTLQCP
jgi:chorismate mutase